jgi:hypothetical protein
MLCHGVIKLFWIISIMAFACSDFRIFINWTRTHFIIRTQTVHVNASVGFQFWKLLN